MNRLIRELPGAVLAVLLLVGICTGSRHHPVPTARTGPVLRTITRVPGTQALERARVLYDAILERQRSTYGGRMILTNAGGQTTDLINVWGVSPWGEIDRIEYTSGVPAVTSRFDDLIWYAPVFWGFSTQTVMVGTNAVTNIHPVTVTVTNTGRPRLFYTVNHSMVVTGGTTNYTVDLTDTPPGTTTNRTPLDRWLWWRLQIAAEALLDSEVWVDDTLADTNGTFDAYFQEPQTNWVWEEASPGVTNWVPKVYYRRAFPRKSQRSVFLEQGIGIATTLTRLTGATVSNVYYGWEIGSNDIYAVTNAEPEVAEYEHLHWTRQPTQALGVVLAQGSYATTNWTALYDQWGLVTGYVQDVGWRTVYPQGLMSVGTGFDYMLDTIFPVVVYQPGVTNPAAFTPFNITVTGVVMAIPNQARTDTQLVYSITGPGPTPLSNTWDSIVGVTYSGPPSHTGDVIRVVYTNEVAIYGGFPDVAYDHVVQEAELAMSALRWTYFDGRFGASVTRTNCTLASTNAVTFDYAYANDSPYDGDEVEDCNTNLSTAAFSDLCGLAGSCASTNLPTITTLTNRLTLTCKEQHLSFSDEAGVYTIVYDMFGGCTEVFRLPGGWSTSSGDSEYSEFSYSSTQEFADYLAGGARVSGAPSLNFTDTGLYTNLAADADAYAEHDPLYGDGWRTNHTIQAEAGRPVPDPYSDCAAEGAAPGSTIGTWSVGLTGTTNVTVQLTAPSPVTNALLRAGTTPKATNDAAVVMSGQNYPLPTPADTNAWVSLYSVSVSTNFGRVDGYVSGFCWDPVDPSELWSYWGPGSLSGTAEHQDVHWGYAAMNPRWVMRWDYGSLADPKP